MATGCGAEGMDDPDQMAALTTVLCGKAQPDQGGHNGLMS
jgi:hypothetical protein